MVGTQKQNVPEDNKSKDLDNAYHGPGTILHTLCMLTHVILMTTL